MLIFTWLILKRLWEFRLLLAQVTTPLWPLFWLFFGDFNLLLLVGVSSPFRYCAHPFPSGMGYGLPWYHSGPASTTPASLAGGEGP